MSGDDLNNSNTETSFEDDFAAKKAREILLWVKGYLDSTSARMVDVEKMRIVLQGYFTKCP